MQKNAKFSSAEGSAPRPPLASGGWGLRPKSPQIAPFANFWLRACNLPVLKSAKLEFHEQDSATVPVRDTTQFDAERFTEKLWANLDNLNEEYSHSVNQYMINFIDIFPNILNKFAPLRKQTRKEKKLKTKPRRTRDI